MKNAKKVFIIIYIISFFLMFLEQINITRRSNIAGNIFLINSVIMLFILFDTYLINQKAEEERENEIFGITKEEIQFDEQIVKRALEKENTRFNIDEFKSFVKGLFMQIINNYTDNNWERFRNFITAEMLEKHNAYKKDIELCNIDETNKISNFTYIKLCSFRKNADKEELLVVIRLNTEKNKKSLLSRYVNNKEPRLYILEFIRENSNNSEKMLKNVICPNCGAIEEMSSMGKCEFCGSILLSSSYNWCLNSVKNFTWDNYINFVNGKELKKGAEPEIDEMDVEKKIKTEDKNFNKKLFYSFSKFFFIKFQDAWGRGDLTEIKGLETEELFKNHQYSLQKFITTWRREIRDLKKIEYIKLYNFFKSDNKDFLEVLIKAKMIETIVDADTMEVMSGDDEIKECYYIMQFVRNVIEETPKKKLVAVNCPNCGAPLKATIIGECEYCKKIVSTGKYRWVLSNIKEWKIV